MMLTMMILFLTIMVIALSPRVNSTKKLYASCEPTTPKNNKFL
jgi:hypothetical protein